MIIDQIIWSKDRPMQLDLLLRSSAKFFPGIRRTYVIWHATTQEYAYGYGWAFEVVNEIMSLRTIPQLLFKYDVLEILGRSDADYFLGNSDDNVFVAPVPEFNDLRKDEIALSLRLNPTVNYCQPASLAIKPPSEWTFDNDRGVMSWDWTKCDPRGCWGYPEPCDSNIYRRQWWIEQLKDAKFSKPAEMEVWMNTHRDGAKPFMRCFHESKLLNICANRIQDGSTNPAGSYDPAELCRMYLAGKRIALEPTIAKLPRTQCHSMSEYVFEEGE